MGKNNNAIQNLRGTRKAIVETSETLLPGQLLYNMTDNYITAGKAAADGSPAKTPVKSAPITVRELHGWTGDTDGIVDENSKGSEYGIKYVKDPELGIINSGLCVIGAGGLSLYSDTYDTPEDAKSKLKLAQDITLTSDNYITIGSGADIDVNSAGSIHLGAANEDDETSTIAINPASGIAMYSDGENAEIDLSTQNASMLIKQDGPIKLNAERSYANIILGEDDYFKNGVGDIALNTENTDIRMTKAGEIQIQGDGGNSKIILDTAGIDFQSAHAVMSIEEGGPIKLNAEQFGSNIILGEDAEFGTGAGDIALNTNKADIRMTKDGEIQIQGGGGKSKLTLGDGNITLESLVDAIGGPITLNGAITLNGRITFNDSTKTILSAPKEWQSWRSGSSLTLSQGAWLIYATIGEGNQTGLGELYHNINFGLVYFDGAPTKSVSYVYLNTYLCHAELVIDGDGEVSATLNKPTGAAEYFYLSEVHCRKINM